MQSLQPQPILRLFKSKIHRATVTGANVDYEGSVSIDGALMDAADILDWEEVHVWNVTRGTRLTTYAIRGEASSGTICLNGAAAHLNQPGDIVILATYVSLPRSLAATHKPIVVRVDEHNHRLPDADELPGPQTR
jgi:aspartate 1-decarboxylase